MEKNKENKRNIFGVSRTNFKIMLQIKNNQAIFN